MLDSEKISCPWKLPASSRNHLEDRKRSVSKSLFRHTGNSAGSRSLGNSICLSLQALPHLTSRHVTTQTHPLPEDATPLQGPGMAFEALGIRTRPLFNELSTGFATPEHEEGRGHLDTSPPSNPRTADAREIPLPDTPSRPALSWRTPLRQLCHFPRAQRSECHGTSPSKTTCEVLRERQLGLLSSALDATR